MAIEGFYKYFKFKCYFDGLLENYRKYFKIIN